MSSGTRKKFVDFHMISRDKIIDGYSDTYQFGKTYFKNFDSNQNSNSKDTKKSQLLGKKKNKEKFTSKIISNSKNKKIIKKLKNKISNLKQKTNLLNSLPDNINKIKFLQFNKSINRNINPKNKKKFKYSKNHLGSLNKQVSQLSLLKNDKNKNKNFSDSSNNLIFNQNGINFKNRKNENKNCLSKGPNHINSNFLNENFNLNCFNYNNLNEFSSNISENLPIIKNKTNNENKMIINKDEFLNILDINKNEFNILGVDVLEDLNVKNLKDNSLKSFNSDLNILHSDLFSYTKFENSRPYKMIEYIMSSENGNSSNISNYNNNQNNINLHKNFLKSKFDKEIYEDIKKTIFNKPKTLLSEHKTSIHKTLFQYIKSDFSNSNIIKIFDKCNLNMEDKFQTNDVYNLFSKDKFTYQKILIEKLKNNYNNDILFEINDTDMLKSLIYIANKNFKFNTSKFQKVCSSNKNNSKDFNESFNFNNDSNISNNNSIIQLSNNPNHNTSILMKILNNNSCFMKNSLDNIIQDDEGSEIKTIKNKKFNLLKRIKSALFFNTNNVIYKNINLNDPTNNSTENTPNKNAKIDSKRFKKFIYRKIKFLFNDSNKKNSALIKSLKDKEQNIKIFCKLIELFSKCREDDFEKIQKKMKDYLGGVDLDIVDNIEKILESLKICNIEEILNVNTKNNNEDLKENQEITSNKNIKIETNNQNEQNKLNNNNPENKDESLDDKNNKKPRNKKLNNKNNLIKSLLDLKSFWINFRILFSLNNILENENKKFEFLTDEKFWRLIFNYLTNKDYRIYKNKNKKIKLSTNNLNNFLTNSTNNSEVIDKNLENTNFINKYKKKLKDKKSNLLEKQTISESDIKTNKNINFDLNSFIYKKSKNSNLNENIQFNKDDYEKLNISNVKEYTGDNLNFTSFFKNSIIANKTDDFAYKSNFFEEQNLKTNENIFSKNEKEYKKFLRITKKKEKQKKLQEKLVNNYNNISHNDQDENTISLNPIEDENTKLEVNIINDVLEEESKQKILNRIKEKTKLFDIYKSNGDSLIKQSAEKKNRVGKFKKLKKDSKKKLLTEKLEKKRKYKKKNKEAKNRKNSSFNTINSNSNNLQDDSSFKNKEKVDDSINNDVTESELSDKSIKTKQIRLKGNLIINNYYNIINSNQINDTNSSAFTKIINLNNLNSENLNLSYIFPNKTVVGEDLIKEQIPQKSKKGRKKLIRIEDIKLLNTISKIESKSESILTKKTKNSSKTQTNASYLNQPVLNKRKPVEISEMVELKMTTRKRKKKDTPDDTQQV